MSKDDDGILRGVVMPPIFEAPAGLKDVSPPGEEQAWQVRMGVALAAWHRARHQKRTTPIFSKSILTRKK